VQTVGEIDHADGAKTRPKNGQQEDPENLTRRTPGHDRGALADAMNAMLQDGRLKEVQTGQHKNGSPKRSLVAMGRASAASAGVENDRTNGTVDSLRDHFAAAAITGAVALIQPSADSLARRAYLIADAMLEARKKRDA